MRVDGDALCRKAGEYRAVFPCHGLHAVHEFQVLALCVVHQCHGRPGHGGEPGDLARVVHAQFDRGDLVLRTQPQQGEWYTDIVVQVAGGGQHRLWLPGTQDRGQHLRHGRLAIGAGDRDQAQVELGTPLRGQLPQGLPGVADFDAWQAGVIQATSGMAQCGGGASCLGLGQELVRVVPFTLQGDKQVSWLQAAGVGVDPRDHHVHGAHADGARQPTQHLLQGHHAATPDATLGCHACH